MTVTPKHAPNGLQTRPSYFLANPNGLHAFSERERLLDNGLTLLAGPHDPLIRPSGDHRPKIGKECPFPLRMHVRLSFVPECPSGRRHYRTTPPIRRACLVPFLASFQRCGAEALPCPWRTTMVNNCKVACHCGAHPVYTHTHNILRITEHRPHTTHHTPNTTDHRFVLLVCAHGPAEAGASLVSVRRMLGCGEYCTRHHHVHRTDAQNVL